MKDTWYDEEFISILKNLSLHTLDLKKSIIKHINPIFLEEAKLDIQEVTIPEFISYGITTVGIRIQASVLQAFQTYRYSIYDILSDEHYYKNGAETILKRKGKEYAYSLDKEYKRATLLIARQLEKQGILNANTIVEYQYSQVILNDKMRHKHSVQNMSVEEIIKLNEKMLFAHTYPLALLSQVDTKAIKIPFYISNALCTLEDLEGALELEDMQKIKATIPVAFLLEEFGVKKYSNLTKTQILNANSINNIKKYIIRNLDDSIKLINRNPIDKKLLILPEKIRNFTIKIPEIYLK